MTTRTLIATTAILVTVLLTGCTPKTTTGSPASTAPAAGGSLAVDDPNAPMPAPGTCHIGQRDGQPLPDPHCTPGAINSGVTQADINDTICKSGWTSTVRPPSSKTSKMKVASDNSYSLATDAKGEYDHLVSLELGGAPDDPRNLWVEPGSIPNPKDAVENKLNQAVCSGLIPLATAQTDIASDWVTAFDDAGLRVVSGKVCLRDQPTHCATGRQGDSD